MSMLRRLSGAALGLAAATTAGALAQTPTFRSGVDLLTIEVTAIGANDGGRAAGRSQEKTGALPKENARLKS
jgi:hypothetical protein